MVTLTLCAKLDLPVASASLVCRDGRGSSFLATFTLRVKWQENSCSNVLLTVSTI